MIIINSDNTKSKFISLYSPWILVLNFQSFLFLPEIHNLFNNTIFFQKILRKNIVNKRQCILTHETKLIANSIFKAK
jgi:hypothetical protein